MKNPKVTYEEKTQSIGKYATFAGTNMRKKYDKYEEKHNGEICHIRRDNYEEKL